MKRIACSEVGLALFFVLAGLPAVAQTQAPATSQSPSSGQTLGDYARQIRKDPGVKATPKVFDNDNLPREDKLSVVGQPRPIASDTSADNAATNEKPETACPAAADGKTASDCKPASDQKAPLTSTSAAKAPVEDEAAKLAAAKQWDDKIAAQREQIDLQSRELDVIQREYQLRAAAIYADVGNRLRNSADWDKQDAQYKQQIADKQKALDDAKQKLDDLQEEARKAGAKVSEQQPAQ